MGWLIATAYMLSGLLIGLKSLYNELKKGETFNLGLLIGFFFIAIIFGPFLLIFYIPEYHQDKLDAIKRFFTDPVIGGDHWKEQQCQENEEK